MPKTFSEQERKIIKQRLIEEAEQCLIRYGARKTTVDELVRRVNIPKGTFYLFYDSKELLFYDVFLQFHNEIHKKMLAGAAGLKQDSSPESLTRLIFDLYKQAEKSFLLKFITEGDLEMMLRKLPPEVMAEHAETDDFSIGQLISAIPGLKPDRIPVFSAALRGVFLSMLHKNEIGDEVFDDALRVMIHGIVIQMFGGENT
jgi:AcrR family transcriptional regulator